MVRSPPAGLSLAGLGAPANGIPLRTYGVREFLGLSRRTAPLGTEHEPLVVGRPYPEPHLHESAASPGCKD